MSVFVIGSISAGCLSSLEGTVFGDGAGLVDGLAWSRSPGFVVVMAGISLPAGSCAGPLSLTLHTASPTAAPAIVT
ncbi:MAG TPA: hypothetical protein EYP90_05405, partial [Chromatiaceae bacterium]|nr:hypothetical protein [Chromatiaceae bacterium]